MQACQFLQNWWERGVGLAGQVWNLWLSSCDALPSPSTFLYCFAGTEASGFRFFSTGHAKYLSRIPQFCSVFHSVLFKEKKVLNSVRYICTRTYFSETYQRALYRKSDLCIPRNETSRPRSHFLHSGICERFIYSQDQSAYFASAKLAIMGKYTSLQIHECGNLETEHYNSVSEIMRPPRSFISGTTWIRTWHLYWILTGPSYAVWLFQQVQASKYKRIKPSPNAYLQFYMYACILNLILDPCLRIYIGS